jgi:outer membrane protease
MKWRANGGHFAYWIGSPGGPVTGTLPDQLAAAYQQSWDVPYLGLGASYTLDSWTLTTEAVASPYVMSRDQDLHALRNLLIKGKMSPSTMFGLSAALEYRITENLALSGQVEYQKFYEAKGDGLYTDLTSGSSFLYPKPGVGMAVDTLLLNLGLKGRI